ncbi:hypothetical protein NDU88_010406 [Pleurodeles waltl]|uniref:Uncharacterized protein n=1 Tax=Pleurodeles waltl TaxID=8319 RepID=A0AAV7PVG7_PLEWA|nr:hypothetical protein NDU88_010406 [Pleurodeles waltl]
MGSLHHPRLIPGYNPVAGPPLVPVPGTLEQTYGVTAPRSLGPGQTPAAISLPITVGPPVPLYAQGKTGVCDQGVMTQKAIRGGSMGTPQIMAPGEQVIEQPRPLMDLSPVGAPLEAMRQAGLGVLTPQTMSTNTSHSPMMHAGNISLQGFTVQQLNEWLEKAYTSQKTAVVAVEPEKGKQDEYLNFVRLGAEAGELVEGTMGVNRLESYTEAELRYLCHKITKECKRGVDWPTKEPARDKVTGAPSEEVMKYYHKVIEFLKQKVSPKVTDWQKIDPTSQEVKKSIHAYYERLLKAFKHYSGTETIEPKDMNHLVFRFVEGLRPEVSQMIKNHLICWQAKPIDEVLQYAKYCSDEIELKQKKLKEKVMVMQIRAAQAGIQGNGVQQMIQQQPRMNGVFQTQPRGRGRGFVNRGSDMNTVVIQNDVQGAKKMSPCHACGERGALETGVPEYGAGWCSSAEH